MFANAPAPANVATALETMKPYAVDVSSGIEKSPGLKDHSKMKRFAAEVRKFERNARD